MLDSCTGGEQKSLVHISITATLGVTSVSRRDMNIPQYYLMSATVDGLYGSIIIEPDAHASRPFHLINSDAFQQQAMREAEARLDALLLADYTHIPFDEFDRIQSDANVEILCMDSIIVNGGVSMIGILVTRFY